MIFFTSRLAFFTFFFPSECIQRVRFIAAPRKPEFDRKMNERSMNNTLKIVVKMEGTTLYDQ